MRKLKLVRGFTLIEMICVISIIGILATIAIPQFSKYIDKANETKITSAVLELNNNLILLKSTEYNKEISIGDVIKEVGDNNLGLKVEGNTFNVGKYKGEFILKDEKIAAKINQPYSAIFSLNGKYDS